MPRNYRNRSTRPAGASLPMFPGVGTGVKLMDARYAGRCIGLEGRHDAACPIDVPAGDRVGYMPARKAILSEVCADLAAPENVPFGTRTIRTGLMGRDASEARAAMVTPDPDAYPAPAPRRDRGSYAVRFASGDTVYVNRAGRCEDAPCCGCCS